MTHASLFSGISGAEIAATWMGWTNLFHCEINPFGRKVLEYWYPNSTSYEDITKTDFSEWRGRVDVLTAGFPCQPFSVAGKRKGADDDRYLWPQVVRAVHEIRPAWVVGENVAGILTMVQPGEEVEVGSGSALFDENHLYRTEQQYVLETVCQDLEREGYSVQPFVIPACAVGAPHRRDRVWIVARLTADTDSDGRQKETERGRKEAEKDDEQSQSVFNPETTSNCADTRPESLQYGREDRVHTVVSASDTQCCRGREIHDEVQPRQSDGQRAYGNGYERNASYADNKLFPFRNTKGHEEWGKKRFILEPYGCQTIWSDFPTQSPVCSRDDGLPFDVDSLAISFAKWRQESIKAYGNAWCAPVAYEIFRAIQATEDEETRNPRP